VPFELLFDSGHPRPAPLGDVGAGGGRLATVIVAGAGQIPAQIDPDDAQADDEDDDRTQPGQAAESLILGCAQHPITEALFDAGDDFLFAFAVGQPASDLIAENLRLTAAAGSQ
jgi:hypothetical protein